MGQLHNVTVFVPYTGKNYVATDKTDGLVTTASKIWPVPVQNVDGERVGKMSDTTNGLVLVADEDFGGEEYFLTEI